MSLASHAARSALLVALAGCAHPTYALRVARQDASFPVLVAAASRTLDDVTGDVDRRDMGQQRTDLYSSKGVEELSVRLETTESGTQLSVYVDRPELYPPGVAEAFWRKFTLRLNAGLGDWAAVERGEAQAALSAPVVRVRGVKKDPADPPRRTIRPRRKKRRR